MDGRELLLAGVWSPKTKRAADFEVRAMSNEGSTKRAEELEGGEERGALNVLLFV